MICLFVVGGLEGVNPYVILSSFHKV